MRSGLLAFLGLGIGLLVVSWTAAAQVPIGPYEGPGVTVGAFVAAGALGPGPQLPVDAIPVATVPVPVNLAAGPVDPVRACTLDDVLVNDLAGFDTLPCRKIVQVNANAACASTFDNLREVPHVGATAADAVVDATGALDAAASQALATAAGLVPAADVQRTLAAVPWGDTTRDLVTACSARVHNLEGLLGLNASELIVGVDIKVPVCIAPGITGVCDSVDVGETLDQPVEGTEEPILTNDCAAENLRADCGNVSAAGIGLGNPFEPTYAALDALEPQLNATVDTNHHLGLSTPPVGAARVEADSGTVQCLFSGWDGDTGILPGAWGVSLFAFQNGGQLPAGLQRTIAPLVVEASGTAGATLGGASALWASTARSAVEAVNAAWQTEVLDALIHPEDNGAASPTTDCLSGTTPPSVGVVEVPAAPLAAPAGPDPAAVALLGPGHAQAAAAPFLLPAQSEGVSFLASPPPGAAWPEAGATAASPRGLASWWDAGEGLPRAVAGIPAGGWGAVLALVVAAWQSLVALAFSVLGVAGVRF